MQSLQIAASEVWVTLIFCIIMYLFRNELKQKKVTRILMLVCITRLMSDAVSWAFDGLPGLFWGTVTRISNYLTFVSNDLVSLVFSVFLWQLVRREGEKPGIVLKTYWALEGITVSALTLNLYFGWFYSFDSSNLYSRGTYYRLTHVAPIAALLVVLWMLIRYHDRFSKNLKILEWCYLIPMALATAYEYMNFGLSLQAYAQAFSALVAFFVGEIELREDLILTHQRLEQANRAKTMFLNNMSHDIRTPMNAIIGFTSLAASHADQPDKVREYLKKISVSSEHLLSLINDVLDMSRIESGKVKIEEKPLHLPELMHDLRTIIQPSADSKQLDFRFDIVDVVDEDIIADKLRLTQILLNILSNGVKYNKTGGKLTFRIRQEKDAPAGYATYHFIIKDTGIGMSEEFQKHIFENFSREETSTVSGIQGTGLGMSITKKSIDMMGGTIRVSSTEGVGSEFDVCLTFRIDEEKRSHEKEEIHPISVEDCKGRKILLVEDNSLNQEIAVAILEEAGFVVEVADDGSIAVEKMEAAKTGQYDLVLMDIQMPVMNGYEATRRIRAMESLYCRQIPIIAMTANAFEEDRALALQAGMNDYLAKPIRIDQMLKVISKVLRG